MIINVVHTARIVAEAVEPMNHVAVISITTPNHERARLKPGFRWVLRLDFHDVDVALPGVKMFTIEEAKGVVAFLSNVEDEGATSLLVHCDAGLSRSAAVAAFVAESRNIGGFDHKKAVLYNRSIYSLLRRVNDEM